MDAVSTTNLESIARRLTENEPILADYVRRLVYLRANTVPQIWSGNSALATSAYLATINSLEKILVKTLENDEIKKIEEERAEAVKTLNRVMKPLRAIELRVSEMDSRSINLEDKIERIEHAHEAADQLPTDLETLKESRKTLEGLMAGSTQDQARVRVILDEVMLIQERLVNSDKESAAIIGRCDAAYRATTSEGLASAFSDRSKTLGRSMWVWVVGLIISLSLGAYIGSTQLHNLADTIRNMSESSPTQHSGIIWIDFLLSLLSVGTPIWFAWVATKQIGQRFRLAEDYGYKSSISKAYEGYRREAELLDPAFQARLFASALSRLDEISLRLVETDTHGSPLHELASSAVVKKAINIVPDFAEKVVDLARVFRILCKRRLITAEAFFPQTK